MIPREIIDEIVFRNDVETVIGSYVTLKRAGSTIRRPVPSIARERRPSLFFLPPRAFIASAAEREATL